jgi:hypothetical protein
MREDRDGIRCDMCFGKSASEVLATQRDSLPAVPFVGVNNPMPTGDHWRTIAWLNDYRKRGQQALVRMPPARRDFMKRAAIALQTGGFHMEIASIAARKFRDDNDLRMQRGKVFVFVSLLPVENDHVILPGENGGYEYPATGTVVTEENNEQATDDPNNDASEDTSV